MILDEMLPPADATQIDVSAVVSADPDVTFAAVRDLDLLTVQSPLVTASMWARGLPDRLRGRAPRVPDRLTLAGDGPVLPGWVRLGERADEICVGAVGRFWTPGIQWRATTAEEFPAFHQPGWGKLAVSLSVRPYGAGRSLLTYECRVATFDDASRRGFARYWRLVRPFVRHIMTATVRTMAVQAELAQRHGRMATVTPTSP